MTPSTVWAVKLALTQLAIADAALLPLPPWNPPPTDPEPMN